MSERENHMAMLDFSKLVEAKQFALTLMDEGVQFTFCPAPLSISYPLKAREEHIEPVALSIE